MRTTRLLAASTTLALSLLAVPALAEDGKAFSGSACQATVGSGDEALIRGNGAQILNSANRRISCRSLYSI